MNGEGGQGAFTREEIDAAVQVAIAKLRVSAGDPDEFVRALANCEEYGLPIDLRGLQFVVRIDNLSELAPDSLQDA